MRIELLLAAGLPSLVASFHAITSTKTIRSEPCKLFGLTNENHEPYPQPERRKLLSQAIGLASIVALSPLANAAPDSISPEADNRRIQIFERTAPSVVFIDTFVESQDFFSTNM